MYRSYSKGKAWSQRSTPIPIPRAFLIPHKYPAGTIFIIGTQSKNMSSGSGVIEQGLPVNAV